jgi:hypothetical protein
MNARLIELKAEERYARERYQLYKAKAYSSRLTSPGRLRELERRSKLAKRRLDRARADQEPVASVDDKHVHCAAGPPAALHASSSSAPASRYAFSPRTTVSALAHRSAKNGCLLDRGCRI